MTSGQQANRTGGQLEHFIEDALIRRGYSEFWNHKAQAFANRAAIGGKQYLKQVPVGPTIYQTARIADFLVFNKEKFPDGLIIECKWQQSAGSVDEKYPFLLFNVIKRQCQPSSCLMVAAINPLQSNGWQNRSIRT